MGRVIFFSANVKLDLTKQFLSFQESNSRLNNRVLTKFVFPFKTYVNDEVIKELGDLQSVEFHNVETVIEGTLLKEGVLTEAKLYLLSIYNNELEGEIDYGLEDIPNFDKKLEDLPLDKFAVDDIHIFAKEISKQKWPETNFNFPRMYTTKYPPTEEMWDAFDGYYNDLKTDGSEMRRNYIDADLNIFNVNIIHPCPHPIYLLQVGFADKGYQLSGDILEDVDLYNRWVFSGTKYFKNLLQARHSISFSSYDYYDWFYDKWGPVTYGKVGKYSKSVTVDKAGDYSLKGVFHLEANKNEAFINVYVNNVGIYNWRVGKDNVWHLSFNIALNGLSANSEVRIEAQTVCSIPMYEVFNAEIIGKDLVLDEETESSEVLLVTNPNEIDLSRAVPNMTFGEYTNRLMNWLNYDMDVVGKTVVMNRLDKNPTDIKDFRAFEFNSPKRKFSQKKSFLLKFAELDNEAKLNSMFYDKDGARMNVEEKTDTNVIEIDGYALPVELAKPNGYTTAIVKKDSDSTLALVGYEGLQGNQNNAVNPPGLHFPELFPKNWQNWLRLRLSADPYEDSFLAYVDDIGRYKIKDYIMWHNNIHQIASWTKQMVSEDVYRITMQTETIN